MIKTNRFRPLGFGLVSLGLASILPLTALAGVLKTYDVGSLPGGRVEVKLGFDSVPPEVKGYTIEQPARISLDLPGTTSELPKYNNVGFGNTKSITVIEAGGRTRMIFNLTNPSGYETRTEGNNLFVLVGNGGSVEQPEKVPAPAKAKPERVTKVAAKAADKPAKTVSPKPASKLASGVNALTSIDFNRGKDGEGQIKIGLSSRSVAMNLEEKGGRLQLSFPGAKLPVKLRNRLDVIDFATPVQFIDAKSEDGLAKIIIEPKGPFDYLAWQADDIVTISVKALSKQQVEEKRRKKMVYSGEKLSLNFQDIEVRDVLQILADFKNLNLVASDTVEGRVTLRLKSVPWDQALDIVLKSKGLGKRQDKNVLIVAPAVELAAQEREILESEQQIRELAPLFTELLQVNYADAADVAAVLVGEKGNRILSERGSVQVINRTNSLLLQETQKKLDEIRELLSKIDIPIRQVMIEARIVNADTNFRKELGVKWGGYIRPNKDNKTLLGGQGAKVTTETKEETVDGKKQIVTQRKYTYNQLFTDMAVSGAGSSALAIGLIRDFGVLNLELSAMENDGGGEIISQPKVITSDKQKAVIKSGKEIPYQQSTSSGATSVEFKDAVLSLEVTPQITPDGRIIMDIRVTNNDSTTATSTGIPIIDTNEVETKVLIEDGQTIVLGGIFKNTTSRGVSKVPLLGDLPAIGRLFRKDMKRDTKSEVLIFITPKIIAEAMALR